MNPGEHRQPLVAEVVGDQGEHRGHPLAGHHHGHQGDDVAQEDRARRVGQRPVADGKRAGHDQDADREAPPRHQGEPGRGDHRVLQRAWHGPAVVVMGGAVGASHLERGHHQRDGSVHHPAPGAPGAGRDPGRLVHRILFFPPPRSAPAPGLRPPPLWRSPVDRALASSAQKWERSQGRILNQYCARRL